MSVLAVLVALLIEQARPSQPLRRTASLYARYLDWSTRNFDAGLTRHAGVVWALAVALPVALVAVVDFVLTPLSVLLVFGWHVAVLYLTLGFRPFSHHFTAIREALDQGDEPRARALLAAWQGVDAADLPRTEVLRQVIEYGVLASHRHVFGVMFWYVLAAAIGLGPAGALLYRLAGHARFHWSQKHPIDAEPMSPTVLALADQIWHWIDFVPARATAVGFAIVGNFEESIAAWRRDAGLWADRNEGVVLAAAAGAIGVQLGSTASAAPAAPATVKTPPAAVGDSAYGAALTMDDPPPASPLTIGSPPLPGHLGSVVGLVWRSVVLWLLLLALLSIANLLG
jgi:adenosylcobinamide-phosphate synthase